MLEKLTSPAAGPRRTMATQPVQTEPIADLAPAWRRSSGTLALGSQPSRAPVAVQVGLQKTTALAAPGTRVVNHAYSASARRTERPLSVRRDKDEVRRRGERRGPVQLAEELTSSMIMKGVKIQNGLAGSPCCGRQPRAEEGTMRANALQNLAHHAMDAVPLRRTQLDAQEFLQRLDTLLF